MVESASKITPFVESVKRFCQQNGLYQFLISENIGDLLYHYWCHIFKKNIHPSRTIGHVIVSAFPPTFSLLNMSYPLPTLNEHEQNSDFMPITVMQTNTIKISQADIILEFFTWLNNFHQNYFIKIVQKFTYFF